MIENADKITAYITTAVPVFHVIFRINNTPFPALSESFHILNSLSASCEVLKCVLSAPKKMDQILHHIHVLPVLLPKQLLDIFLPDTPEYQTPLPVILLPFPEHLPFL